MSCAGQRPVVRPWRVPALLACSATHQYLIAEGLRTHTGLVVDTGSAKEIHHFALLAGYGAEAICPWLTFKTIENISNDFIVAQDNYIKAVGKGLFKVMSKMGISTYQSYCGAQIFEAVGLNQDFINQYFRGTSTNIEGIGTKEIAEEMSRIHQKAFGDDPVLINALDAGGEYAFRIRGEEHMWNPDSIAKLQHATRTNQYETYKEYAQLINDQTKKHKTLRHPQDKCLKCDQGDTGQRKRKHICGNRCLQGTRAQVVNQGSC